MDRIVIGVTGDSASGKGVICSVLKEMGFSIFSLSDELRKEAEKRKWSMGRKVLQDLGDELREKNGFDILTRWVASLPEFKEASLMAIDGIRHPAEIDYLRDFFDATIIGVVAPDEKEFEHMRAREREDDPRTFEEFLEMKKRERGEPGSHAMQLDRCLEMADITIKNEGTEEELRENASSTLLELGIGIKRIDKERGGI